MNKDAILKSIGAIGRASTKLTRDIQKTAVACALHALQHGDVTLADQLVEALGKGMRKNSLRAWFEVNTPMYLPKGKDKFAFDSERAKALRKLPEGEFATKLAGTPWEDAQPEPEAKSVFDVEEAFDKFMARLDKMTKEAGLTIKHAEMINALRSFSAEYHSAAVTESTEVVEEVQVGSLRRAA